MIVSPTLLPEVKIVEPRVFPDDRGFFLESYQYQRYAEHGITARFVQDNHSRSIAGTVRGLHYQLMPGQSKLVRCVVGEILDIAVDIRRGSPTFGKWVSQVLSATNHLQLYVPVGYAHGFCVLSDIAEVEYKVDSYYAPQLERGIRFDDPVIGVEWPVASPLLSPKDRALPLLADADIDFDYPA